MKSKNASNDGYVTCICMVGMFIVLIFMMYFVSKMTLSQENSQVQAEESVTENTDVSEVVNQEDESEASEEVEEVQLRYQDATLKIYCSNRSVYMCQGVVWVENDGSDGSEIKLTMIDAELRFTGTQGRTR